MSNKHETEEERGAVLVFTAISIVALLLISAMAIDIGYWYVHKNNLRQVAEAAALAGAAYMPKTDLAFQHASAVEALNGITYYNDSCATHSVQTTITYPDKDSVSVKIVDCKTQTFFSSIALGANVSTSGEAVASVGAPIPLGSPTNHLGTNNFLASGGANTENFWLAISGFCEPKEQGDQFAAAYDNNVSYGPIWGVAPYNKIPTGTDATAKTGSVLSSCGPLGTPSTAAHGEVSNPSWIIPNHDYNATDSVYKFLIKIPDHMTASYRLLAYDPAFAGCDEAFMNKSNYQFDPGNGGARGTLYTNAFLSCDSTKTSCATVTTNPASPMFCYDSKEFNTTDGCASPQYKGFTNNPLAARGCSFTSEQDNGNGGHQPDGSDNSPYASLYHPYSPVTTIFDLHNSSTNILNPIGATNSSCPTKTFATGYYPKAGADAVTLTTPGTAPMNKATFTDICSSTGSFTFGPSDQGKTFYLQVNTLANQPFSFGENFFSLLLENTSDISSQTMSDCNADTATSDDCPQISAVGHLPVLYKLPGASATPTSFHLARFDKSDRGRLVTISVWDPAEGMQALELDTAGSNADGSGGSAIPAVLWDLKMRLGDNGCYGTSSAAWGDTAPTSGGTAAPAFASFDFGSTGLAVSGLKPNNSDCDNNPAFLATNYKYNRQLVQFQFRIPSTFNPTTPKDGWIFAKYTPSGANAQDRTTWSLKVNGTPIRLTK